MKKHREVQQNKDEIPHTYACESMPKVNENHIIRKTALLMINAVIYIQPCFFWWRTATIDSISSIMLNLPLPLEVFFSFSDIYIYIYIKAGRRDKMFPNRVIQPAD